MVWLYTYHVLFMKHPRLDVMSKYDHEHVSKYESALHIKDYTLISTQHNMPRPPAPQGVNQGVFAMPPPLAPSNAFVMSPPTTQDQSLSDILMAASNTQQQLQWHTHHSSQLETAHTLNYINALHQATMQSSTASTMGPTMGPNNADLGLLYGLRPGQGLPPGMSLPPIPTSSAIQQHNVRHTQLSEEQVLHALHAPSPNVEFTAEDLDAAINSIASPAGQTSSYQIIDTTAQAGANTTPTRANTTPTRATRLTQDKRPATSKTPTPRSKARARAQKAITKDAQHAAVQQRRQISLDAVLHAAAASNPSQGNANTTQGEAEGQDDLAPAAQPSMEDLIADADGEIAHDEEAPANVNEDEIHNDEDNAEDVNDSNDVAELPRPTRPNPNYIADREPFHTPGYKHKSKPPPVTFYAKKGERRGYTLDVGLLFGVLTWLPMFMYTGKPLYDSSYPLLALSITIGMVTRNAPREWLPLFGEYLSKFCVCGIGGLERGGHLKHLHVQCVVIIHAPDDNANAVLACVKRQL